MNAANKTIFDVLTELSVPTFNPSISPSQIPTKTPSLAPIKVPSVSPSQLPTTLPSVSPTNIPSISPVSQMPTKSPSESPTILPSMIPSLYPTHIPSITPLSQIPTKSPSGLPTKFPSPQTTIRPSNTTNPTENPTDSPSHSPLKQVSLSPSKLPSSIPSISPTQNPTTIPSLSPNELPSISSSDEVLELKQLMKLIIMIGSIILSFIILCTCIIIIFVCYSRKKIYENHITTMTVPTISPNTSNVSSNIFQLPKEISEVKQTKTNSIEFSTDKEGMNSNHNTTTINPKNIGESYHESNNTSNVDLYIKPNNNFVTTKGDRKRYGDV